MQTKNTRQNRDCIDISDARPKAHAVAGLDYWPNEEEWPAAPPPKPLSLLGQAVVFMCVFSLLQISWLAVRDNAVGHFIRGDITVSPAVSMINFISPQLGAIASGNQIKAPGGGIVIKLGCEGVEAVFILMAAFASARLAWRPKLTGILIGTAFVYVFNLLRIMILFYAYRMDKPLFYLLHGSIAPIALIMLSALFFYAWLLKHAAPARQDSVHYNA